VIFMSSKIKKRELLDLIAQAGVIGAGGGGFPTSTKLSADNISHFIANGAECEPLLQKDIELMLHHPKEIASAMAIIGETLQIKNLYFSAKRKYTGIWQKIEPHLKSSGIQQIFLDDIFPAGDEFEIVRQTLGKTIPPANIPLAFNAIVNNVETIFNIFNSLKGKPVTEKWLTITGEVKHPFTASVPIGTPAKDLLDFAEPKLDTFALIEGGPMMGALVSIDEPVKKTTSGFIVLPEEHPIIRYRKMPMNHVLRIAASACMQCQACTDLCPRYLLGHPLEPHKIMRASAMPLSLPVNSMTAALLCSECGVCELFACPMGLSPRRINRELKEKFANKGIKYRCECENFDVREERDFRRIPSTKLIERLQIVDYHNVYPDFVADIPQIRRVVLPLKQHAGAPAIPIVKIGENVKAGQLIAKIPEGKLGANLHASIDGKIVAIAPDIIIRNSK